MPTTTTTLFINPQWIFYKIYSFLQFLGVVKVSTGGESLTIGNFLFYFKLLLVFVCVFSTFLIIDFLFRIYIIRRNQTTSELEQLLKSVPAKENENKKWLEVERLVSSDNESDWKLAVIEADKMLDELLVVLGYKGDSLGDRLLSVEKGDVLTLDEAWEAHKYRNKIAHESAMQVSEREAKRIIGLYRKVFLEFKFI